MSLLFYSVPDNKFSNLYIEVRKKEKRFYTEEQIKRLPTTKETNIHYKEWKMRENSACRFTRYLKQKKRNLNVLDIGCGNGWFSNLISIVPKTHVTGIDINLPELEQAVKVFQKDNLTFAYANLFDSKELHEKKFDIITFNSCVQYFENIAKLIKVTKKLLSNSGEIHIIDSPFYDNSTIENAKQHTRLYYEKIGFPEMTKNYFHHNINVLENYKIMYKPLPSLFRFFKTDSPFLWVKIASFG